MSQKKSASRLAWLLLCMLASGVARADSAALSEQDYFSELPEVLTVTRLVQPLSETPGAVTVIDRETLRHSGARDLFDALRLVPGYLVGGINGAHQTAAYHAPLDDFGIRNLVLIDGRNVYSTFYLGGTNLGLASVLVEDIERIEVLRGSNSAAYGANAMFGVINVITRHAADTRGVALAVSDGDGGIRDRWARVGWGNETASFRVSAGRLADDGYKNAYDDRRLNQLHFRGDLRLAADEELRVSAGMTDATLGDGEPGAVGNPERDTEWRGIYLQGEWRRQFAASDEIRLMASYDHEQFRDRTPYAPDPSVQLDFGGEARRAHVELQHTLGLGEYLRSVWGVGFKYEDAHSPPLYYTRDNVSAREQRLFGNLEWRPHARWLVNAGALWGNHSWTGEYFSPRLMTNFHVTPDHTLRVGVSRAVRTPTLFELASDVRYYPKNALNRPLTVVPAPDSLGDYLPYFAAMNQPVRLYASTGSVEAEQLHTSEIGYFGNFRALRLTLDVRAYVETARNIIDAKGENFVPGYLSGVVPAGTLAYWPPFLLPGPLPFAVPINEPIGIPDFTNEPGFRVHGVEWQLRWKPVDGTEVWVNQAFSRLHWDRQASNDDVNIPPTHASTVALFQKLPYGLDLSLIYHTTGAFSWGNDNDALPNRQRLDARLAWPFRIGATRLEAAFVVQAAGGEYPEYLLDRNRFVERRAFGTLRLEF